MNLAWLYTQLCVLVFREVWHASQEQNCEHIRAQKLAVRDDAYSNISVRWRAKGPIHMYECIKAHSVLSIALHWYHCASSLSSNFTRDILFNIVPPCQCIEYRLPARLYPEDI